MSVNTVLFVFNSNNNKLEFSIEINTAIYGYFCQENINHTLIPVTKSS